MDRVMSSFGSSNRRRANVGRGSPRPWVKICGLSDEATVDAALARGADEIGFVHFPRSPRHVTVSRIAELVAHVNGRAATAVVCVDPDDAFLDDIAFRARPDTVQLHGAESPGRVAEVKNRTKLAAMKAISVCDEGFGGELSRYLLVADRVLLDAKPPKGADLPGGNGVSFDWTLFARVEALGPVPVLLSGGLRPENVGEALRVARPKGLDVSSGVEAAPGVKSADLINRFFDALERALPQRTHP